MNNMQRNIYSTDIDEIHQTRLRRKGGLNNIDHLYNEKNRRIGQWIQIKEDIGDLKRKEVCIGDSIRELDLEIKLTEQVD